MTWKHMIVYFVLTILLSVVFEVIDIVSKKIKEKIKARKIAEAQQSINNEEV